MTLETKIKSALALIARVLEHYKNPVVMSSFGKDSMVLLDLVKRAGHKLPILFHREPFFPLKYEFARQVISFNNYEVWDYAPSSTAITKNGSKMEVINYYQVGKEMYSYVPTGIRPPEPDKPYLCGYLDLYMKPTGTFNFPWDVCLVGHKSTDIDPILGPVPLLVDIRITPNGCDYAFPLRHFTNEDVWEYHSKFNIPVHHQRYDPENNYLEREDITSNPDYHHACMLCLDRDSPSTVMCPKLGYEIPNISHQVRSVEPQKPEYIGN